MYQVVFTIDRLRPYTFASQLEEDLANWNKLYGIPYKKEPGNYTYTVLLALDKDATWFALTWEGIKYDSIVKV